MPRSWMVVFALAFHGCDSPQVVSFNTPELCVQDIEALKTFSNAVSRCEGGCVLCVESELNGEAASYSVSRDDNCVCPAPRRLSLPDAGPEAQPSSMSLAPDAGTSPAVDGGSSAASQDAGRAAANDGADAGGTEAILPGSDGCHSRLHLTRSEARSQCSEWEDCQVCVERVDFEGDARSYMAHQCGCPDAYRIDPD